MLNSCAGMCTIQLWLCELTMVVCTKLFKMKHVRPKGRVYWTPKHVKQPHLRINRHMMFWEHNNAEQHFNNCQSALWCKHVQIGDKQNCTMHHSTKYGICFFTHVGKAGPTLYLYHGDISPMSCAASFLAIDLATACQTVWSPFIIPTLQCPEVMLVM